VKINSKIFKVTVEVDGKLKFGHAKKMSPMAALLSDMDLEHKQKKECVKMLRLLANKIEKENDQWM
jgi:hypothetical protein